MGRTASDILINILSQYKGKGVEQASNDLKELGERATKTGKFLSARVTLPLAGIGAISLKAAADFDRAFNEVNSLLDASDQEVAKLRQGVRDLAKDMGVDLISATQGLYNAISAGIPQENALTFLETASRSAIAGVTDVNTSVDLLTTVLNAYGLEATQAGEVSDRLFATVRAGKTTFPELASSIGQVAPLANSADVSLEQLLGSIATLTKQGVSTPQAVTQIRAAITSLLNPTETLSSLYDQLGVSGGRQLIQQKGLAGALDTVRTAIGDNDKQLVQALGSIESFNGTLGLTGENAKTAAADLDALSQSAGATEEAFNKVDQGSARALQRLNASLTDIRINIAEAGLTEVLEQIASLVEKASENFSELPPPVRAAVVQLAALAAIAGPMLILGGAASKAAASMLALAASTKKAGIAANLLKLTPIGAALSVIALVIPGVVSGFADLNDEMEQTTRTAEDVEREIERVTGKIEKLGDTGRDVSKKSQLRKELEALNEELRRINDPLGTAERKLEALRAALKAAEADDSRNAAGRAKTKKSLEDQIDAQEKLINSLRAESEASGEVADSNTVVAETGDEVADAAEKAAGGIDSWTFALGELDKLNSRISATDRYRLETSLIEAKAKGDAEEAARLQRKLDLIREEESLRRAGIEDEEEIAALAERRVNAQTALENSHERTNNLLQEQKTLLEQNKSEVEKLAEAARNAGQDVRFGGENDQDLFINGRQVGNRQSGLNQFGEFEADKLGTPAAPETPDPESQSSAGGSGESSPGQSTENVAAAVEALNENITSGLEAVEEALGEADENITELIGKVIQKLQDLAAKIKNQRVDS